MVEVVKSQSGKCKGDAVGVNDRNRTESFSGLQSSQNTTARCQSSRAEEWDHGTLAWPTELITRDSFVAS